MIEEKDYTNIDDVNSKNSTSNIPNGYKDTSQDEPVKKATTTETDTIDVDKFIEERLSELERRKGGIKVNSIDKDILKEIIDNIRLNENINNKSEFTLNFIKRSIDKNILDKEILICVIEEDYNILSLGIVRLLIQERYIVVTDFKFSNIQDDVKEEIINLLTNNEGYNGSKTPGENVINKESSSELYFWGLPSSGKTCILGSLMSFLTYPDNETIISSCTGKADSPGYEYMEELISRFTPSNGRRTILLPSSTPPEKIYSTDYTITINGNASKEATEYPIRIVDMAGETLNDIYGIEKKDISEEKLKKIEGILSPIFKNKDNKHRIHFFVVDYSNKDFHTQSELLLKTFEYLKKKGILDNSTKKIYIIVSKIDKMGGIREDEKHKANRLIKSREYINFKNKLKESCWETQIGVDIRPYSIGKVYFQNICIPDTHYPKEIFEEIKNVLFSRSTPSTIWGKFVNIFIRNSRR